MISARWKSKVSRIVEDPDEDEDNPTDSELSVKRKKEKAGEGGFPSPAFLLKVQVLQDGWNLLYRERIL